MLKCHERDRLTIEQCAPDKEPRFAVDYQRSKISEQRGLTVNLRNTIKYNIVSNVTKYESVTHFLVKYTDPESCHFRLHRKAASLFDELYPS